MFLPFSPYITHFNSKNATCPLFKQMKLSIDEKVQNFESLIESQLDLKTLAEMDDLETAMRGLNSFWWRWSSRYCSSHGKLDVSGEESCLYKEGEFIIGLFTSGTPGEVTSTSSWFPVWFQLISLHLWDNQVKRVFWKRSSEDQDETFEIHKNSVLPIWPVLSFSNYSTNRNIIYDLVNVDLVMKFV